MHKTNHPSALLFLGKIILLMLFPSLLVVFVLAGEPERVTLSDSEVEAIRLSNLWELEPTKQAIYLFQRTATDWQTLKEPRRAVFCLNEAAKLSQIISDHETSFRMLNKALELENESNLPEDKVVSLSLFSLFSTNKGNKVNAKKYSEQALSLSRNLNSSKAEGYALFSSGMFEYYYGKQRDATDFFDKAADEAQETQDIFLKSQTLSYLSYSYFREGVPARATDKMNLALQECKRFEYKRGVAISYFGLAFTNYHLNEKQKALDLFKKSESLFPRDFEWLEKARTVNAIGVIYLRYGEFDLAENYFQQAISYYEKVNHLAGKISSLTSLAEAYLGEGELIKAKATYNLAESLTTQIEDEFRLALIREGIGNIDFRQQHFDKAIYHYLDSLKTYNKIGVRLPNIENLIGNAFEKRKEYEKARKYYTSALDRTKITKDYIELSESLFNLSKLDFIENREDESLEKLIESLQLTETLYSDVANSNLKRSYFSNVYERYELYINLLMQKHKQSPTENFAIQALQASEKARSRSLLETLRLSEANFTKDASPELVQREKEILVLLNLKTTKLTELLSNNADKTETDKVDDEIRTLNNELEEIKAKFKQDSPIYSAIKNPPPFDVAEFQQNVLDDKTLLLEFSLGEKESYLWLIGKNEVSNVVLPARNILENRIEKIRQAFDNRQILPNEDVAIYQKRIADLENLFNQEASLLSNDLLGKVADKITDKRLIVVPDGKLNYLPLTALPFPNSAEPLILRNEIVYEPSASLLNLMTKMQISPKLPNKDVLIFSDPVFSTDDNRLTTRRETESSEPAILGLNLRDFRLIDANGKIPRLFASQDEAVSIQNVIGKSRTTIANGFEANRERVLQSDIADYRVLHFATHGLIDVERPEVSSIVLSQFDEAGQKREGFLRLQDIYALDLASDLVVLSACQSGVGKDVKGEGLLSLNNAFLQAGAKSVLSSAWKVDDYATAELMKNFYSNLTEKGSPPAQALRQAQITMSKSSQFKSPFYWAAFTVQGDFRQPVSFKNNNLVYYFGSFILLILLGGLFWKFKTLRRYRTAKL